MKLVQKLTLWIKTPNNIQRILMNTKIIFSKNCGKIHIEEKQICWHRLKANQWFDSLRKTAEVLSLAVPVLVLVNRLFTPYFYFQTVILNNGIDSRFRFCDQNIEIINRLLSGCSVLTPFRYMKQHLSTSQNRYWKINVTTIYQNHP